MAEYINKREAMDAILQHCKLTMEKAVDSPKQLRDIYTISHNQCIMVLQTLMPADVVPRELYQRALSDVVTLSAERKRGEWISMMGHSICNVCGYKASPILTNFCPNCGARMVCDDV